MSTPHRLSARQRRLAAKREAWNAQVRRQLPPPDTPTQVAAISRSNMAGFDTLPPTDRQYLRRTGYNAADLPFIPPSERPSACDA